MSCNEDRYKIHLCSSCQYTYPSCPAGIDDCKFGNGVGNDNVIECNKYIQNGKTIRRKHELEHQGLVK